jgi:hypothetical protein
VAVVLVGVGCCLVELFGKSSAFGSCCVEVGFCSFGADAEGGEDIRSGGQVMLAGLMAIAGPAPVPSADQRGPAGQAQDGRAVRA